MTTDIKAVARYYPNKRGGMMHGNKGDYILFTDHERVVGELKEYIKQSAIAALELDALNRKELAKSRAEVEGLQRVKEIVAKTRRSNSAAYEQACQNDDCRMQAICNARTSLLNNIDEAMKEQAE